MLLLMEMATAVLDSSTLDSSAAALASATSVVLIGRPPQAGSDDGHAGHDHGHGAGDGSGDVHGYWSEVPSTPSTYTVSVGDKLSFQYTAVPQHLLDGIAA